MMRVVVIAAMLLLATGVSAFATAEHSYERGEYAVIRDGVSPDKRLSLASHADGEGGFEDFHVWLMSEPNHRRLVALDDISSDNNLDTAPDAYHAIWSQDSRHVAVTFRRGRHVLQLNLYGVRKRHAVSVARPSLFEDVLGRPVADGDDMRASTSDLIWKSNRRFVLRERRLFMARDARFAARLGRYGRVDGKRDDGLTIAQFAAEADCVLLPGNHYRIIDLRPMPFMDAGN